MTNEEYSGYAKAWDFATLQPIVCSTKNGKSVAINTVLELRYQGKTISKAISDNIGRAILWIKSDIAAADCQLFVNGIAQKVALKTEGINEISSNSSKNSDFVQIAFVVDATGSMNDELRFLQNELFDVIGRSKGGKAGLNIATSSVFYRDAGDSYVTRVSAFSPDANETVNFIKKQSADGGGDFPEAVHSALEDATQKLVWSPEARTRILFLILDAPPHTDEATKKSLEKSIATAQEKGIKIIPIVASGINKETEFLMRHYANATNGTYVFITDHSGIGGAHLEPTVGKHDIEFLANLMVRLIQQYSM
jgi:hypothetical protein